MKKGSPYRSEEKGRGSKKRSGIRENQAIRYVRSQGIHSGIVMDATIIPDQPQTRTPLCKDRTSLSDRGRSFDCKVSTSHTRGSNIHPGDTSRSVPATNPNRPAQFHGGISHSLGIAVAAGLVLAALFKGRGVPFATVFLLTFVAYSSHLALDLLGPDARKPIGIPVLWPISGAHFISPVSVLPGVQHAAPTSTATSDWIRALLSLPNVVAIVFEVAILTPVILVARLRRDRSAKAERAQVEAERN